ncbi:hypothetical protein COT65_00845 [Candidatus Shapirobacteria bacterium CG09_land_8_20_14_0_10_47_13]|uniref:Uncharacterized protein n=1 Tax=Candidatus Shapirobacteria bacterium CG09_land_8_20_14_0_10_47_13 TaxID=1974481 RepID=A0A2H0WN43_9BACT|nr:MAG: hypothetical protein COT65_00845 [Candidatus Shapirobacteria bacterium CG09_land_8_20_14_0_10_47_13]
MIKNTKTNPLAVNVKTGTVIGSVYSQLVGVTVTDVDLTLEFVYVNPRATTEGQVVARVTLLRAVGERLAKAIGETVLQHEAKKKGKN